MALILNNGSGLRVAALITAATGTMFRLYTFFAITQVPPGDSSGFQWAAVMPLGMILLVLTLPALVLSLKARSLRTALEVISEVARRHGISPEQLFGWRAKFRAAVAAIERKDEGKRASHPTFPLSHERFT